jgi:alginate O-acetyltransferase complex protein AlgI
MIFTTYWFLLFALVVIVVTRLLPWKAARMVWLGAACVVFHYHFAGPAGVLPIVLLALLTYFAGLSRSRGVCLAAMVVCVAALAFYKYSFFLIGAALAPISPAFAERFSGSVKSVLPGAYPLAISFFIFEFVHYLFEVRRGGEPIRNPLKFLLFAIFFPSLVAGPIKRYTQFLPSLDEATSRGARAADFAEGAWRVALGFFKKVVIADQLTTYIDQVQPHFAEQTLVFRWLIVSAIAFRILLDFSGYSDIAIGCARMLGVRLPENFNWPYLATNIRDFWQRWHISLSSWIRDYVYIPLGGNRHGRIRQTCNGLIAFGLCGLWHGPAWHFVTWGVYHGTGLVVSSSYRRVPVLGTVLGVVLDKERWLPWVLTIAFVGFGWLLFFYPVDEALAMTRLLFSA